MSASAPGDPPLRGAGIEAVVFDLGGVLLELADPLETFELDLNEAEFHAVWLGSRSVREFERGAIDVRTFAEAVVTELGFSMDAAGFLARFNAWPRALFPDTLALLDSIPHAIRRVLLSNTNAAHWRRREVSADLVGRFDHTFLSYLTGVLKPDRAAFAQVATACACAPGELLFFDDNPGNVAAARRFGMQAYRVQGPAEVRRVLDQVLAGAPSREPSRTAS